MASYPQSPGRPCHGWRQEPRIAPSLCVHCAVSVGLFSAALVAAGCATQAVWTKWNTRDQIDSIGLQLQSSRPSQVEIGWRALIADRSNINGQLTINTSLEDCEAAEVLVAQRSGPPTRVLPREKVFEVEGLTTPLPVEAVWAAVGHPRCSLLLIFRKATEGNTIAVSASWQRRASRAVEVESIGAPRHPVWLTLLPASVVADSASVIVLLPIALCLGMGQDCVRLLSVFAHDD